MIRMRASMLSFGLDRLLLGRRLRTKEMDDLAVRADGGSEDMAAFYTRLDRIRDYHARHPDASVDPIQLELAPFQLGEHEVDTGECALILA